MAKTASQSPLSALLMERLKAQELQMAHRPGRAPPSGGSRSLEWAALYVRYQTPSTAPRPTRGMYPRVLVLGRDVVVPGIATQSLFVGLLLRGGSPQDGSPSGILSRPQPDVIKYRRSSLGEASASPST
jgi:hypothetical protein